MQRPAAVEVMRKLGGRYADQRLAVTMNRMRCKTVDGKSWTMVRVRELRERLGIAAFDPQKDRPDTISVDETARRLKICIGSVHRLIREGILPARQVMHSAPWEVPVDAPLNRGRSDRRAECGSSPANKLPTYKRLRTSNFLAFDRRDAL